jgi:hypothetical protein
MPRFFPARLLSVIALLAALEPVACGPLPTPARVEQRAPERPPMPEVFRNKCEAARGQLRPLVVEWPAPDRAALETQASKGQLVVHYEGCELEVLRRCRVPLKNAQRYRYTPITPKEELVTMSSADQLYASIPVYAAKFEGKLSQSGQLNAAMMIVGEYGLPGLPPALDQLEGECAGATHVVAALTVGAFSFFSGAATEAGASVQVLGFGGGVETSKKNESLSRDGDTRACGVSRLGDQAPPQDCGALLRLELAALRPAGEGEPDCKPGTRLVGKKCLAIEKPVTLADEDKSYADGEKGNGWGHRCLSHLRAGALPQARAACQKGLDLAPDPDVRGSILFNYSIIEERAGDPVASCRWLRQSLAARPGNKAASAVVQKKIDEMKCAELLSL